MVSSTEIPNAILNTRMVEGFKGMPVKPITPAVMISGNRLGINEMRIILKDRKRKAINKAISNMAKLRERMRLFIRYFVPFKNNRDLSPYK